MINEIIVALKIYEKRKIKKFSVKDFLVNVIKSTFSCIFG